MQPPVSKENEFAKITSEEKLLHCTVKSWFLKFGFYWKIFPSPDFQVTLPVTEIKKMTIRGHKVVGWVFFILAAMVFGFGFISGKDQITGQITGPSSEQIITTSIIALVLVLLGFFFLRSKTGRLKTLYTTYNGVPVVLYASPDIEELKSLKQLIGSSVNS